MGGAALVALIGAYRPADLDLLRQKHPAASAMLESRGLVLGTDENDAALRDAAVILLDNADGIANQARVAAFARLRFARRLEMAGSIVSVASSVGVVSALLDMMDKATALPIALAGFVGGAVPLVVGWLRSSDGGMSIAEAVAGLREVTWQAQVLRGKLARGEAIDTLVETVNGLAQTMAIHLETLGHPGAVRPL